MIEVCIKVTAATLDEAMAQIKGLAGTPPSIHVDNGAAPDPAEPAEDPITAKSGEEKGPKKQDVRAVLIRAKAAGYAISDLLKPYGDCLGDVDPSKYGELIAEVEAKLAGKEAD